MTELDVSDTSMIFAVSMEDEAKVDAWLAETVYPAGIKQQKLSIVPDHPHYQFYKQSWDSGYPYTGAIGGSLTYAFSPTSLGVSVIVKDALTGLELDLTDYGSW
jgi:hypothetical protein